MSIDINETIREIQAITGDKSETVSERAKRAAWEMHHIHRMPFREIAERQGCSYAVAVTRASDHESLLRRRAKRMIAAIEGKRDDGR